MTITRSKEARSGIDRLLLAWLVLLPVLLWGAGPAAAWVDLSGMEPPGTHGAPDGITIISGDYVMNVGELHINITNWGLIGSHFSWVAPYSDSPSAQWPAGSGVEYLWAAGLWVGGVVLSERLVSTGQYETEFRPLDTLEDTIYEAKGGVLIRPPGNDEAGGTRAPEGDADDDGDLRVDEEFLNGYDDDLDGLIDEDFAQIANQMMVTTTYDNTRIARETFPDHSPMNLRVVQQAYAWENDTVDDFVGFEFFITNMGVITIDNVYIGFFADPDIGPRGGGGVAENDLAGFHDGLVRASDGTWIPISVGYMYDGAETGRVDGYIGILFLGHDTDPSGNRAPPAVRIRSYQSFSGQAAFDQGGDPGNDDERYELLSVQEQDRNTALGRQNDFRFLVSAGPFKELPPDETLQFQAGIVTGYRLEGLLNNCAEAALTWYGNYFDLDSDTETGINGRETLVCREDFETPGGSNPFDQFHPDYMDTSCVDPLFLLNVPLIQEEEIFNMIIDGQNKNCAYVNMDNCFECQRQLGIPCTSGGMEIEEWNCWDPEINDAEKIGCTGVEGKESQVHWLVGLAPPPPGMRLWPTDNAVYVYWDDSSEHARDIRIGQIDFESYQLWRADNWDRPFGTSVDNGPQSNLWQMIAEFDLVNNYISAREAVDGSTVADTLPLGLNTGLEGIAYTPRVLDTVLHPEFDGLAEAMQVIVDADYAGRAASRPPIFDGVGDPIPGMEPLLPWQGYPAVMDTFWAMAAREEDLSADPPVRGKRGVKYYQYVDRAIHNGFLYFYAVTATDHILDQDDEEVWNIEGGGLAGDPGSSFTHTRPGSDAQTVEDRERFGANIYAYPNPATREALTQFQELNPSADDPTGVRVCFANLPRAVNTISIFTLDGDLVQELEHDGTQGYGQECWNLMSRNGQEVVSGIYLFSVQSDDDRFDDVIGKFVVIR